MIKLCLENGLVVFTISGYEGEIYGIYSIWRDLEKIVVRGHFINALRLEADMPQMTTFPSLEMLSLPSILKSVRFNRFPRLTKLQVDTMNEGEELLAIWDLRLTALIITSDIVQLPGGGIGDNPPAFAQTLRSLHTRSGQLLDLLSPFCRNLQEIASRNYHEIMANNNLTSLTVLDSSDVPLDLTRHTHLIKLHLKMSRFFSKETYPSLQDVSLSYPDTQFATQFLAQCPALRRLSLTCANLKAVCAIIAVLNPKQCILDVKLTEDSPSLDAVKKFVLLHGFRVNKELLLWTCDAKPNWESVVQLAPEIKHLSVLKDHRKANQYLADPCAVLPSFHSLSVLDLTSSLLWTEEMLVSIVQSCPLEMLRLYGGQLSGALKLHSQLLRKVILCFDNEIENFDLKLPNLTHLNLALLAGEDYFLQRLLDGDSLIDLPLLRVLSIIPLFNPRHFLQSVVSCKVGHPSLTRLLMKGTRLISLSQITLQHLPQLREVSLHLLRLGAEIILDVPGDCDITLVCWESDAYIRRGYSDGVNFKKRLNGSSSKWVENEQ